MNVEGALYHCVNCPFSTIFSRDDTCSYENPANKFLVLLIKSSVMENLCGSITSKEPTSEELIKS